MHFCSKSILCHLNQVHNSDLDQETDKSLVIDNGVTHQQQKMDYDKE